MNQSIDPPWHDIRKREYGRFPMESTLSDLEKAIR